MVTAGTENTQAASGMNQRIIHSALQCAMTFAMIATSAFALMTPHAVAQTIKIMSPASGVIVHPGETLPVTIDSLDAAKFTMVVLISQDPFGFLPSQSALPASVAVKIPESACCHKYQFTAVGALPGRDGVDSQPITIDVEPLHPPMKLRSQWTEMSFRSPGGSMPIDPIAEFATGPAVDVTYSSRITYLSTRPEVAQVDEQGTITAKSPGKASILVVYAQDASKVQLTLPVTVNVGPIAASAYSIAFPDQAVGAPGVEKTVQLTAKTLGPLKILKIATTGDYSESDDCSSAPLPHEGSCFVWLKFTPHAKGVRTGELTIVNNFSGEGLVISLSGIAE